MRPDLLRWKESDWQEAIDSYVTRCVEEKERATIADFASTVLQIKRPTFYAKYPGELVRLRDALSATNDEGERRRRPNHEESAVARIHAAQERIRVAEENRIYALEVRRLTIENERLRRALENYEGIRRLDATSTSSSVD